MTALGFRVINIDCVVFAQRPKLLPFRQAIRQRIADILESIPNAWALKARPAKALARSGWKKRFPPNALRCWHEVVSL